MERGTKKRTYGIPCCESVHQGMGRQPLQNGRFSKSCLRSLTPALTSYRIWANWKIDLGEKWGVGSSPPVFPAAHCLCHRSHYSVQTRTKTEVLKNALQSGYLQTRKFAKTQLISASAQKRIFSWPRNGERIKTTETGVGSTVSESNVNSQTRTLLSLLLNKNRGM